MRTMIKEASWINHYYNCGIYFKDGYTYPPICGRPLRARDRI